MTPAEYYTKALDMCLKAYAEDLTPRGWRMPERDLAIAVFARDLAGRLVSVNLTGEPEGGRTMMGLPVEIMPHATKPHAVLSLICAQTTAPEAS